MASEQFSLCWDNFHKNMSTGMQSLLETEDLVDVTLAVEGKCLKAHKMVLSLCSPYFREMFQSNPCKHPIVFMKDVSYVALSDLLHFMYQGEVQVSQENLSTFIKTAEALQIKGLTGDSGPQNDSESDAETEKTAPETVTKRAHEDGDPKSTSTPRTKRFSGPASKRPKFSSPVQTSTPVPAPVVATTGNRYEVASVNTNNVHETEDVDLKVEPHEATENSQPDTPEDNQLEQYADDTSAFEMTDETEDYSLIESTNDDPKPGPSTGTDGAENQDYVVYSVTKRGKKCLLYNNYMYYVNQLRDGRVFWVCSDYYKVKCRSRIVTDDSDHVRRSHQLHNHPPHVDRIQEHLYAKF